MKKILTLLTVIFVASCSYISPSQIEPVSPNHYRKADNSEDLTNQPLVYSNLHRLIITPKCLRCHGPENKKGGVDLSSLAKILESELIVTGDPEDSLLYQVVFKREMPPRNPLNEDQIEFIRQWIEEGAL